MIIRPIFSGFSFASHRTSLPLYLKSRPVRNSCMRRTALIIALIVFTGFSAATAGYDGPSDQPHIMGEPSDKGSASQGGGSGPDGSEWHTNVTTVSSRCISGDNADRLENIRYTNESSVNGTKRVRFTGYMKTPNPCYTVDLTDVIQQDNGVYTVNISSKSQGNGTACAQCVGMIEYRASFSADSPFKLEVLHDGQYVDTVTYPGYSGDDNGGSNPGFIQAIINWFNQFF